MISCALTFFLRNVVHVKSIWLCGVILVMCGCDRLPALTIDRLEEAERRWSAHQPAMYELVIEMSGDRVERGRFDVEVRSGHVVNLRRNGFPVQPRPGEDYSMEGLFRMLKQELALAEKPAMLGAAPGYSIYLSARFDADDGRLIHYRRTVGGTANGIDVDVVEYRVASQ
jgi:hypothetical protein